MRKHLWTITISIALLSGAFSAVRAQLVDPVTGYNVDYLTYSNSSRMQNQAQNMFDMYRLGLLMIGKELIERQRIVQTLVPKGLQIIKSGRATTRFKSVATPLAPQHYAELQAATPAKRQELVANFARSLQAFHEQERARGGSPNDLADALGLYFVLSYEVFSGNKPNAAQFAGIVKEFRSYLLRDALHQGMDDRAKQLLYEEKAINAMAAVRNFEEGARGNNQAKQAEARALARKNLAAYWTLPVEAVELTPNGFGDRGTRIINEGRATTRFDFISGEPLLPKQMAQNTQFSYNPFHNSSLEEQQRRHVPYWENYYKTRLADFRGEMKRRGLTENDLAEAGALAVAVNYEVYSGGQRLTAKQFASTLAEMRQDILRPAWQGTDDREKQRAFEHYAITAMTALDEYAKAENERVETKKPSGDSLVDSLERQAQEYAERARQSGIESIKLKAKANLISLFSPRDFNQYTLTETGFVKSVVKK